MKIPSLNLKIPLENYFLKYSFNLLNTKNYSLEVLDNSDISANNSDYLYKYYGSNDYSFDSLNKNYFYLNSPDKFNDPFDCAFHQEEIMQAKYPVRRDIYNNLGVTCFSNNYKDPSMWNRYTNDYCGFCLKFKREKLVDRSLIEIGSKVFYTTKHLNSEWFYSTIFKKIDTQPITESAKNDIKFALSIVHKYCQKSIEWKSENEYRIVSLRCIENNRQLQFNPECLEEIYLGYKMSEVNRDIIVKLVHRHYPKCKIFSVKPSNHRRELVFLDL